jgi:hypothetical protein
MRSRKFVQCDVQNIQEYLAALTGYHKSHKKPSSLFTGGYNPELYESPELDPIKANFYQLQI